jgi:serine/threonine protein kinase
MLLYPVARLNLAEFLDSFSRAYKRDLSSSNMTQSQRRWKIDLSSNSVCLLSALRCIHKSGIKHMDIKPQNVLLKWTTPTSDPETWDCKMLLCDFGISHIFESNNASQTSSFFGRAPKYAAPEVAADESHGRAADIFSLGCVFTEMNTVFAGRRLEEFDSFRHQGMPAVMDSSGRTSYGPYHRTIPGCQVWVRRLSNMEVSTDMIAYMLEPDPLTRPRLFTDGENISVDDSDEKAIEAVGLDPHAGTLILSVEEHEVIRRVVLALYWFGIYQP